MERHLRNACAARKLTDSSVFRRITRGRTRGHVADGGATGLRVHPCGRPMVPTRTFALCALAATLACTRPRRTPTRPAPAARAAQATAPAAPTRTPAWTQAYRLRER